MPKSSKTPPRTSGSEENSKLYAQSYGARLAKQVGEELGGRRASSAPRKKKSGRAARA